MRPIRRMVFHLQLAQTAIVNAPVAFGEAVATQEDPRARPVNQPYYQDFKKKRKKGKTKWN